MLRSIALATACLALLGCSDDSGSTADAGAADLANTYQININDQLLGALEVRFLKGRCLGRARIDSDSTAARAEVIGFAEKAASAIPGDGSKPATDEELKAMVPGSGEIAGWAEDTTDQVSGPWLITTNAFDWINGAGKPFDENGFEAAAGESYTKDASDDAGASSWSLTFDIVNQGSPAGATAAFEGAGWDQGSAI